ncbi:2-dehydro-3-deoxy-6-phosphogalactonate aldolase [Paraglaciecola arctica]|uniref:2-dehydro-3-deoxy-6-phosphogalactonate aldolase n=1 Tax=Paraglaciecola arctica TaxID=1128911 RepID=UPI001C06E560|nr:2-dehydro-3-deoxy-6-phosphogalactonate aldolase [Paraglaciecola arctica]MBU3005286.1 2-dehydro-3-deoxy-6-phosphogalactonate aldolase [Paraglaciecola arctica]
MQTAKDGAAPIPLIAIIRGVTPDTCLPVASELIAAGFTMIEVPLNSPDALVSIKMLVEHYGTDDFYIGAGTVTTLELAEQVIATGANLVVTPNCDPLVIARCVSAGCATYPGIVTPTEAFTAIHAGATGLKIFPVSMVGVDGLKAMKSVVPADTEFYPVGGIDATNESMAPYLNAGAKGFGLGSSLYKPTMSLQEVRVNADNFVQQYQAISA